MENTKVIENKSAKGHWEGSHYITSGKTGYWSKYGGAIRTTYENQHDRVEEKWTCQSCSHTQPKEMNAFLFEYPEKEYIRVCAICYFIDCDPLKQRLRV